MKTKSDIVIRVLYMGIGLAVGIVLIAKVFFELSYDSFYKDIGRVYTIRTWYKRADLSETTCPHSGNYGSLP